MSKGDKIHVGMFAHKIRFGLEAAHSSFAKIPIQHTCKENVKTNSTC